MLEEQLAFYLEKYLGPYVLGLSKEALKVFVWQGDVELTNMQLKPEALNALKLPIKVKAGFLGSVKLKIPWSRLGQEPVVVELDRIFILAEPATNVQGGESDSVQEAKNRRVREQEQKLVNIRAENRKKAEEASNTSWLGSLICTVIANLKLSITNIHIRYEDEVSNAGHPFAAGVTLAKLAAVAVDEDGKETFVTGGAFGRIPKSGELNRLSVYFDSDTKPWPTEKPWQKLVPEDWNKVFLPGIQEEPSAYKEEKPAWIEDHSYVLEPVGGTASYFKLGQKDKRSPDIPFQKAIAVLDDVTISLTEKQYRDALKLAENISTFSKHVQYAHYRPTRSVLEDKKGWWHYVYTAVSEDRKKASGHLSWRKILEYTRMRKKYVSKYIEALQKNPNAASVNDSKEIKEMDRQLDSEIIIQWRMLAHTFVDQERKKGQAERQAKQSWWSFGWGGGDGDDAGSKEFTDEDWRRVNHLIGYEEGKSSSIVPGGDEPNMLHTLVEVQMRHNGTKLLSASGESILELTAEGLGCGIKVYPKTKIFNVGLNSFKITTPEGLLGESAHEEKSLHGTFTLSPWDKQLDWSLEAKAAPCYLTVWMQSIHRITQFFASKEAVSRDVALQTAAALQSTVNEVSKNAQQQLNDALKNKPKFFLDLDIAAPKLTIPTDFYPDGQQQCKMFLDLGYFSINTMPADDAVDDSEENQLYMRFRIGLKDVSAFLVDGDFDWRKRYDLNTSTGRLQLTNCDLRHDGGTSDFEEKGGSRNDIQEDYASQTKGKAKQVFDVGDEGLFFLPMLEKTGITVALEQICVPHPKYPTTRVAFRLQSLGFQFSPARYHRIMQVVEVFAGSSDEEATDSAFRPWDSPDFDGQLSVLSWKIVKRKHVINDSHVGYDNASDDNENSALHRISVNLGLKGVGHREAKWEDRYGALAGPFLYLLESESSRSYKTYHSLIGKKLFNVPRESLGDVENVIAICDAGQLDNKVAESAGALLLRFVDEDAKNNWQGRFAGAIYRASSPAAVAGLLSVKDENNHTHEDVSESANTDNAKLAEQEAIFLTGVLDELKIVVSNSRDIDHTSPKLLLAPENPLFELRAIGTKLEFVMRKNDLLLGAVLQTLEIEDKFHGHVSHSCRYLARSFFKRESKVKEERNLLTGGSKGETKQLRYGSGNNSSETGPSKPKLTQQRSSGDERFFDANDESGYESSSSTFSLHRRDSSSDRSVKFYDALEGEDDQDALPSFKRKVGLLPESASSSPDDFDVTDNEELKSFVKAQVIMTSPESPAYASIDKEVRVSLSTLSFYCNRPTVVATLDLVTAITADVQLKEDAEPIPTATDGKSDAQKSLYKETKDFAGPSDIGSKDEVVQVVDSKGVDKGVSESIYADAKAAVTTINPKVVEDVDDQGNAKIAPKEKDSVVKGLLGKGKGRVMFLLVLDLEFAEIVLNKEDGSQLATLSQDNFHTDVKIYPASWGIKATLGNLRISDDNVKDYHHGGIPYQYICDMRDSGGSSFIELEFMSFNKDDLDYEGYDYSVTGKLSEVRLVFLNRFIQEVIAYFMGLVPQTSGYVMRLKDRASDYEKLFSQSEIEGQPSLKLNISLLKPIIIMPRGTYSTDFMELDILHINIRSSSEWFGDGKDEVGAIRLETIKLDVEDVSLTVGVKGNVGSEIFDRARGIGLVVRRPLRDLWHKVPGIEATVKIEELRASLADKEYQVITECVSQNMAEIPDLPPTMYDHEFLEEGKMKAEDQAQNLEEGADDPDVVTKDPEVVKDQDPEGSGSSPEKPYTMIKVGVRIDLVELRLFVGGTRDASLATVQVFGVWASYKVNNVEESVVMASLERLSLKDEREGIDPEMQFMVGYADDQVPNTLEDLSGYIGRNREEKTENGTALGTSNTSHGWGSGLTMIVVDAKLGPTQQKVSLRIQRPRVVVAFDFLLAVGEFFVPSMHGMLTEKGEENPLDMKKGIFLNNPVYKQTVKEIRISPKKPLVADYEGVQEYIYDGQGNTLRLLDRHNEDISTFSPDVLIFVGDGKRLIFRNVVIQDGEFLDSSLYLGSNSSYSAFRDDGVFFDAPPEVSDTSSTVSSHLDDKKDNVTEGEKPPVELVFDLQAIGPELTLYDSVNRSSESLVLSERHLRARMNVFARFSMNGDDVDLTANLNGFTVESTTGVKVLEPFDASATYSLVAGQQNIHIAMTDIYTNFSFSILQLILRLEEDVMSIMRITSEQITVECSEFEKIWADDDSQIAVGGSHLAFWRPRPPPGFAVLGDCLTPLDEPPAKGVLTVNMALARGKRPTGFEYVWSSIDLLPEGSQRSRGNKKLLQSTEHSSMQDLDNAALIESDGEEAEKQGCSVWLPIPPEGYVALGCVVWKGQEEPPKSAALCVLSSFVSPCSMQDCIYIQSRRGSADSDERKQWAFWRVDNSIGTFYLQNNPKELVQPQPYDLRLSISSQRLFTVKETVPSSGEPQTRLASTLSSIGEMESEEESDDCDPLPSVVSSGRIHENVGRFKLVWWDKGGRSPDGVSIWRPIVPPGRAMLGDLAVKGYEPPSTGLVLRDTDEGLLRKPERFQELAHISKQRHLDCVYFWIPIPPPGYSAMGCIAGKCPRPDKDVMENIRCVRNDLVSSSIFSVSSLWTTRYLEPRQQHLSIWPVENESRTFFVKPGSFGRPPSQAALGLANFRRQTEPDNLTLAVEVKSASVTFYDDFGGFMAPLLDLSIFGIQAGFHGRMEAFSSVVNFSLGATTFNSKFDVWEPLIETCDAVVRYEYNSDPQDKVQPTVSRIRISTQSDFNVNISVANANMLLEAYSSWINLSKLEAVTKNQKSMDNYASSRNVSRTLLKHSTDNYMDGKCNKNSLILAHNDVGEQLWLRTVEGSGKYQVSSLPPNGTATIKLPVTHSIQGSNLKKMVPVRPGKFVSMRIGDAELPREQGIGGREYMAAIRIVPINLATVSKQLQFQSARTRCVNRVRDSGSDEVHVIWDEVFVFEVQSGEVYRAEIVVTDLARGSSVGYCSLELTEKEANESRKDNINLSLRSEFLYPPKTKEGEAGLLGEVVDFNHGDSQNGRINLSVQFFSVYGEEGDDEDSEDAESQQNDPPQRFGAIDVSVTRNGPWSPVRLNYGLGPAPWHLGRDHLASEMLVYEGVKHLFVRTLVTVMNETEYHLEARLCPDFLVGQETEGSSSDVSDLEYSVEEEIFENERKQQGKGWGHPALPTDPGHWSSRDLSRSWKEFPQFPIQDGYVWMTDWLLDGTGADDHNGWAYAFDFHSLKDWPPNNSGEKVGVKASMFVRRRRWIRSRQHKDSTRMFVISLGTLEPQCSVACPIKSLRPGGLDYIFQVKPQVGSVSSGVSHNWSSLVSYKGNPELDKSRQSFKDLRIRGLKNTEELLRCSILASSSDMEEKDAWLCVECKPTEVGKTSQLDPIEDWRLIISAPLELVNFLPVACKYTVSEKANGNRLVPLQSGSVEPGASKAIFLCDLRKALYLKWVPEGGWKHEDDVLISQVGKDPAKRLIVTNGVRDLAIHMQYDNVSRDISARVIHFYVPCWLDSIGCLALKYKLIGAEHHDRKKYKSDKSLQCKKSLEEIDEEAMHDYPTMLSNYDCKSMELAVALSGSECTQFGPVASLDALEDPNGYVDLRVTDDENSHYRFLVTTTSHPKGFAQTQVVRLRPHTLFTNRLGLPLEVRQAGGDQSKTLNPWDWRITLPFQLFQDPLQLQVRLKGSEWSFPFFIDEEEIMNIVVRQSDGQRQSIGLDVHGHEAGSRFLAIFRLGSCRGPYRIENRTSRTKLKYRQAGLDADAWRIVRPHSSAIFAWENLQGEKLLEVIQEGRDVSQSVKIDLDKLGDCPMIPGDNSGFSNICIGVLDALEAKLVRFFDPEMGTQDNGNVDSNEIEQSAAIQSEIEPIQDDQERRVEAPSQMEIVLGVEVFGLSIVDQQPRELIFLSMKKVDIVFASGLGDNVSRLKVLVGYMQVDNQLPLTPMPVLLAPERHEGDFVIKAIASMKADTTEAIQIYPYLGLKLTGSAWRINVHEALIWAFLEMYNNLHLDRLSSDSQVVQVDPEIRIETMDISQVHLKLSVDASPDQRPHGKLGIWGPAVTTLGNISKMPINFRSVFRENRRMRSSQVQAQILNRVKRDLIHQPLQLLTGLDLLGMTSSTLGTMSRGAANLSKDDDFLRARTNQETARQVKGMRDGMIQGTTYLARGVGYGVKGMVTKPIDGADERGFVGCVQGVFKALVGVVVEPLSGCLDFMAICVSGLGTSCTNCFEIFDRDQKFERCRLPRAIKGNGVLTPYDPVAARGQTILHLSQSGGITASKDVFRSTGIFAFTDYYQDHFHLRNNCILMLTNRRVLMLLSPASHTRDQKKELTDPCTIQWEIQWNNLLALESNEQNAVLLHLRDSTKEFTHIISGDHSNDLETTQATEIYSAIYQQWRAYCPTPEDPSKAKKFRKLRRRLKRRPVLEIGKSGRNSQASSGRSYTEESGASESSRQGWEVQETPTTSGDDEFRHETSLGNLIWSYHYKDGSCLGSTAGDSISFWRPDPPPGYVSVGDVAYTGDFPESQTLIVYRNDEGSFEKPLGFDLIWRNWKDGIGSPISMWMPRAPEGYVALGCVVCADYEEPQLDTVWCVDSDLTEDTHLEDSTVWQAPSEAPWHCYIYPVVSEVKTFIALREEKDENTPKPSKVVN